MTWENQQTGQHLSVFFCPEAWYTIYRKVRAGPAPEEPARRALLRRRVLFGNQFLKGRIAGTALAPFSGPGGPKAACTSCPCRLREAFSQKAESRAQRLPPSQGLAAQKPPARLAPAASGKPLPKRQNRGHGACPLLRAWRPKSRLHVLPLPPPGSLFPKGRIAGAALAPFSGPGGPKAACASCPCRLREASSPKTKTRAQRLPPYSGPGGPKAACASCPCRLREAFSQKAESRAQRLPPTRGLAAQKPPARLASAAGS